MAQINFNAELYDPLQPNDTETNPYHLWVRACQLHNAEIQSAKDKYKCAMLESYVAIAKIKQEVDQLRIAYKKLEMKPKPVQTSGK
jgi:hypothetical protein